MIVRAVIARATLKRFNRKPLGRRSRRVHREVGGILDFAK